MQCSLNEFIRAHGGAPVVETIDVTPAMALALSAILRCSVTPQSLPNLPGEAQVLESLQAFRTRFMDFIASHGARPDDQR